MTISELFEQPETWEQRHAAFKRQQAKRGKLRARTKGAEAKAAEGNRRDAARRSADRQRVADLRSQMAVA